MAARLPASFPPAICERLRKLRVRAENAKKKAADARSGRDEKDAEIAECPSTEERKLTELKNEHSDYVREINLNNRVARAAEAAIHKTIENGDDLKLWEGDVDTNPTPRSLLKDAEGEDDKNEDDPEKTPADGGEKKTIPTVL